MRNFQFFISNWLLLYGLPWVVLSFLVVLKKNKFFKDSLDLYCILRGHLEKIDNRNDWYFILHYISFQNVDVFFKEFWVNSFYQSCCVLPELKMKTIDKYCQRFDYINSTDTLTCRFWEKPVDKLWWLWKYSSSYLKRNNTFKKTKWNLKPVFYIFDAFQNTQVLLNKCFSTDAFWRVLGKSSQNFNYVQMLLCDFGSSFNLQGNNGFSLLASLFPVQKQPLDVFCKKRCS